MDKLITYIWENYEIKTKYFRQVVNSIDNSKYFVIQWTINFKKDQCIYYLLIIKPLFQASISFLIFFLFYYYEIKLFSENFIYLIIIYLKIVFFLFILYLIYLLVYGFYLFFVKDYGNVLFAGILNFIKLINFIINVNILYYLLNLNIELFLQYNILLVIDIIMFGIFWVYKYIFDYEIKGQLVTFLSYPWVMLVIFFILLKFFNIQISKYNSLVKNFAFFFLGKIKENKDKEE